MRTSIDRTRGALAAALVAALVALAPALAPAAHAQQRTDALEWHYIGAAPMVASTFAHTVTIDGAQVQAPVTCRARSSSPADSTCAIPIPTLSSGLHAVVISATANGITSTTTISGLDLSKAPPAIQAPHLTITIVINL